jgi:WD40 repeat protein
MNTVTSVTFSPRGTRLASGSRDSTVRIWDAVTGDCRMTLRGHSASVTSVTYSHGEGQCLASGSSDSTLRVWDAATGQCVETLEDGDSVTSVAWSLDNRKLACANIGGGFAVLTI